MVEHPVFEHFPEWIKAVAEKWEWFVGGGILGIILECFKKFREWEPNKLVFALLVWLGFFVSAFLAWNEQREKLTNAETRIEQLSVPDLVAQIRMNAEAVRTERP